MENEGHATLFHTPNPFIMTPIPKSLLIVILAALSCQSCGQHTASSAAHSHKAASTTQSIIDPAGMVLSQRILPPPGFERVPAEDRSFAQYLRQLPLKPDGAKVLYYDGQTKHKQNVYVAVVDLPIGTKNLHQCADAVMRLRADYLWQQKRYEDIHFNFTNGFRVDYTNWQAGQRIKVDGNKTYWVNQTGPSHSYESFWKYLEIIFTYAGTASLSQELKPAAVDDMQIGDVFIKGGFPGHAIIVVDLARNPATGETVFLLAQSYMPAQETQILVNPRNADLSPWYTLRAGERLFTPEWTFAAGSLKRF